MTLREKRKIAGLTIEELANGIGVSKQLVSAWENGLKNIPMNRQKQLNEIFENPSSYRTFNIRVTEEMYRKIIEQFPELA